MFFFKKKIKEEANASPKIEKPHVDIKSQNVFPLDMHLHILPGMDDGSPDVATSLELARALVGWGVKEAYVTPHVIADIYHNTPELIKIRTEQLQIELDKQKIDLKLYPSAEYRMDGDFLAILAAGKFQPMNEKYILVENSFYQEAMNMHDILFELGMLGYQPILAHPERYKYYSRDAKRAYRRIKDMGCLFQVNLLSLAGWYGKQEKMTAQYLLSEHYVDFIGTDMHKIEQIQVISDYLSDSKNWKQIKEIQGNKILSKLNFNIN